MTPAVRAALELAAEQTGLPLELLEAVARAESAFNPSAESPAGARGLMQLMPGTFAEWHGAGKRSSWGPWSGGLEWDAEASALYGAQELKRALGWTGGELAPALAAYNWGFGNLRRKAGWPDAYDWKLRLPAETSAYIARITRAYAGGPHVSGGGVTVLAIAFALIILPGLLR